MASERYVDLEFLQVFYGSYMRIPYIHAPRMGLEPRASRIIGPALVPTEKKIFEAEHIFKSIDSYL